MEKLLIHVCCGPDLTYSFEYFARNFDTYAFFTNSNIDSNDEYEKRYREAETVAGHYNFSIEKDVYMPEEFELLAAGLENEQEMGARCAVCHRMNLEKTAKEAKQKGYDAFSTTLTISPHKNSELINGIGKDIEKDYGIKYISANLKKNGGFLRSVLISKELKLYRQIYCGCKYAKGEF